MADDASLAATVREHFEHFLMSFSSGAEGGSADLGDAAHEYLEQCHAMRENERSTLFVDYQHIEAHDSDLSDAIKERFYELEPHLRVSVRRVVASLHEDYAADRDFHVSFFNLPHISALRELRTDRIASLSSFAATVTRTSDVRPELLHGFFQCEMCSTISEPVAQQFKYTQPIKCKNPSCVNRTEWQLRNDLSKFVDWQRLRVQENAAEMPAGCMPRTLDVILRGEMVERAKAGDKCAHAHARAKPGSRPLHADAHARPTLAYTLAQVRLRGHARRHPRRLPDRRPRRACRGRQPRRRAQPDRGRHGPQGARRARAHLPPRLPRELGPAGGVAPRPRLDPRRCRRRGALLHAG